MTTTEASRASTRLLSTRTSKTHWRTPWTRATVEAVAMTSLLRSLSIMTSMTPTMLTLASKPYPMTFIMRLLVPARTRGAGLGWLGLGGRGASARCRWQ